MIGELLIRFALGGFIVSLFAVAGELFEPKTFAGIFGAAPSVALATLALTAMTKGVPPVVRQAHAAVFGAMALIAYSAVLAKIVRRFQFPAWLEAGLAWALWLVIALGLWALFLR